MSVIGRQASRKASLQVCDANDGASDCAAALVSDGSKNPAGIALGIKRNTDEKQPPTSTKDAGRPPCARPYRSVYQRRKGIHSTLSRVQCDPTDWRAANSQFHDDSRQPTVLRSEGTACLVTFERPGCQGNFRTGCWQAFSEGAVTRQRTACRSAIRCAIDNFQGIIQPTKNAVIERSRGQHWLQP